MRRKLLGNCGVALLLASTALAQSEPVLHEYFDWSTEQDMVLPSSALPGAHSDALPAASPEHANVIPSALAPPDPAVANGAVADNRESGAEQYQLDGNTSQPDRVGYSDPFTPSIPPFKRLFAYDAVSPQLRLIVASSALTAVSTGGAPRARDDQFYGEVPLQLVAGQPARLPNVGPGARIITSSLQPSARFELLRDSAENLFLRSDRTLNAEWVVHLAIERAAFGAPYPGVSWRALARKLPRLPPVVFQAAKPVLEHVGVSQEMEPAEAVRLLVDYFRGFAPEEVTLPGEGVALYREVSLTRRGVCRHRAFAFTVSALALGIPTRFVRNEAHAWVEVYDGTIWHRIDLGGAAGEMNLTSELDVPHEAPADPYTWPPRSESGERMVARSLRGATGSGSNGAGSSPGDDTANPAVSSGSSATSMLNSPEPGIEEENEEMQAADATPQTVLTVQFSGATLRRGQRFALQGTAHTPDGATCALMRVDVELHDAATGASHPAGTLVTDSAGRYAGELVLPSRVPVGDYALRVTTPGNQTCGAAEGGA